MRNSTRMFIILLASLGLALFTACGDDGGGGDGGGDVDADTTGNGDGGPNPTGDGGTNPGADAGPGGECQPGAAQCANCIDDDGDGDIDGTDVHCISAADNDESSFETGISGDNMDGTWQDCFFDGNSGAGDDGCRYHSCCLLLPGACTDGNFDPVADCEITQECVDFCAPSAPPGCDCFGCCTLVNDAGEVFNVVINPAIAPDCDVEPDGTPNSFCPECVPSVECGTACDNSNCTLCPGQTPEDLPPECNMMNECPGGAEEVCDATTTCPTGEFCLTGCCTPQIG